jgi:MFS family permease
MAAASFLMRDPGLRAAPGSTPARDLRAAPTTFAPGAVIAIVGISTLAYYAGYAGLLSQLSPMLADVGLQPQQVGTAMAAVAAFALAGTVLSGAITQWLTPRQSGAALLALLGAVESGATLLHGGAGAVTVAGVVIFLGLLVGGGDPILIEVVRRTVPDRAFARMYGWWYFVCLVGLAAAPLFAGALFDLYGDYRLAFLTLGALTFVCAVAWVWRLSGIGGQREERSAPSGLATTLE